MIVTLKTQGLQTLEQIHAFLEGTQPLGFEALQREAAYDFIAQQLRRVGADDDRRQVDHAQPVKRSGHRLSTRHSRRRVFP